MRAHKPKQILAACISPFDEKKELPLSTLMCSLGSVFLKTFETRDITSMQRVEGALYVEGPKWSYDVEKIQIMRMPLEMIDEMAETFLSFSKEFSKELDERKKGPEEDLILLAIGSSVFCQDLIRYMSMNRKGHVNAFADKFTNRLARAQRGAVIWTNNAIEDGLHEGDLISMFTDAKIMGAIPD